VSRRIGLQYTGGMFSAAANTVGDLHNRLASGNGWTAGQAAGEVSADVCLVGCPIAAGRLLGGAGAASQVANPVPEDLAFARALRTEQVAAIREGGDPLLSGWTDAAGNLASQAFVTSSRSAPSGLTRLQLANGLGVPGENVAGLLRFKLSSPNGIASPINRLIPGFAGRGLTSGGLPEWVVPNTSISQLPWWELEELN
jgi:hypothetical protein